jgi:hypothetical protein
MFPGQIVAELGDILEFKCASSVLCEAREPEALFPSRRRHPGEPCVEAADRPRWAGSDGKFGLASDQFNSADS